MVSISTRPILSFLPPANRIALSCIILFLSISMGYAQSLTISGRVIDAHTEEVLPFTNVYLKGTTTGTTTDLDGNYTIKVPQGSDTLSASAIGYEKLHVPLSKEPNQTILFKLSRSNIALDEVVVVAGENPANIMLRKIIAAKPQNNNSQISLYQCEVYNKLELDMKNIDEEFMNKKLFKPFKFIFENIDSISEEEPYLPMFLTETLSDVYHQNDPEQHKEVIKASKISGVKNESVTQFLGSMYQDINIYENWIPVLGKSFVSPISNSGLFYYDYYLVDSAEIEGKWCYQMTFKPKRKGDNTFIGDMWVVDKSFAIKRISMVITKDVNINFVERLSVYQNFKVINDSLWFLTKDKLIIDFISPDRTPGLKNTPGLIGRKTTSYRDFEVNQVKTQEKINETGDVVVSEDVFEKDLEFWNKHRHEELSENEEAIYSMVDTLKNLPVFRTYVDVITLLVGGWKVIGNVELGPYFTTYSNNAVEGHRFRLGIRTSNKFSTRLMIGGHLAYGTRDQQFKYSGYTEYFLSKKPRQSIGLEYIDDINVSSQHKDEFGQDNIFSGVYRRKIPQKLLRIEEKKMFYRREWAWGFSAKATFSNRIMDPYFRFHYLMNPGEPSSDTISSINTSEIVVDARFAYREKFVSGEFERISLGTKYPILSMRYIQGIKGILNSDFEYSKFEFSIADNISINPIGTFRYVASAGKIFGPLPYLLLEVHPGNETYFYSKHAFNNMNQYEFVSDQYITLFLSHSFEGFILNRIPGVRKLKWRTSVNAKAAWGSLSSENKSLNDLSVNFTKEPFPIPYTEVGWGIENILKVLRVDGVWRINYLNEPFAPNFNVRLSLQVEF